MEESDWKKISHSDRVYDHKGDRTNTSLFLEHNILIGGLTVSAGVMANRNTGLDNQYRFYPGVDVSFRPDDHWKLYASWNKALRLPTFTDLYTSNSAQQGDLNLKPEKNNTYKAGAQWHGKGWNLLADAFYSRGRDMIDWVYETAESKRYHALNIGKLNNMGFNVETKFNLSELLSDTYQPTTTPWLLTLGYAYIHQKHETDREIYKSLYALEYLKHKFVATLSHPIIGRLSASWSLRWQQRMNGYHPYAKLDGKLQYALPLLALRESRQHHLPPLLRPRCRETARHVDHGRRKGQPLILLGSACRYLCRHAENIEIPFPFAAGNEFRYPP